MITSSPLKVAAYKQGFARLPTVDHIESGVGPADFKIYSWRVNDTKHDLDIAAFLGGCPTVPNITALS